MKGSISKIMAGLLAATLLAMPATSPAAAPVKVGAAINLTGPASTWGQYHAKGRGCPA